MIHWSEFAEIVRSLASVVTVVGLPLAYVTYRRSVRARRAEWLVSLHEKFFEQDRYARVRRVLDYTEQPGYSELAGAVSSGEHHPLADELYRYLNFFELLASLEMLGQISQQEIIGLFDYDLKLIARQPFVVETLRPESFERLRKLLTNMRLLQSG